MVPTKYLETRWCERGGPRSLPDCQQGARKFEFKSADVDSARMYHAEFLIWTALFLGTPVGESSERPCERSIRDRVRPFAMRFVLVASVAATASALPCGAPTILGFFTPKCDANGLLLAPFAGGVQEAVDRSVAYYAAAPYDLPLSHNFQPFVWATFMSGFDYLPTSLDIIAGMQDGMGLLSYVKLYKRAKAGRGGNATAALSAAVFPLIQATISGRR